MANYASDRVIINQKKLNGGLNDTAGPLSLNDNESSDLRNVDFDKFGSVFTRRGYLNLGTSSIESQLLLETGDTLLLEDGGTFLLENAASEDNLDGLWWYQSSTTEKLIGVSGDKIHKMDDLDGTWDDITGTLTITAGNHCDFENFLDTLLVTNNEDLPFKWTGTGNASLMTVPTGLTKAKFVKQFQNYTILGNVTVSATVHKSRWYWSTIKTIDTWSATSFIETEKNDGQSITGIKVLGDSLIVFKERKIWKYKFTGDRDIPFVGVRTPSKVGCVAPWSVQEVNNGLVFLSYDGLYFFDGNNSYKLSDRINNYIRNLNRAQFPNAVSTVYADKNRYKIAVTSSGQSNNDEVIVWDYFNNAFSIYDGMNCSAMTTVWVDNVDERPYFGDYEGWTYRMDTGVDDYPLGVQTKINSYYYTNWRSFEDIVDQKGIPHLYLYHQYSNSVMILGYSYDFEETDQYSQTFSLATSSSTYGSSAYGTGTYGGSGGGVVRRDLTGMGRVIRYKFQTNALGENFQIDGIGNIVNVETFV